MAITVAKTAGFCFGVKRAMDLALSAAHQHREQLVYTLGPLVHNPQAVELLRARHILPAETPAAVTDSPALIRAHGVPLAVRKELSGTASEVIDATCPHVAHAQNLAATYSVEGYAIIIVGDRGHPEVVGILGYVSEGRGFVIESPEEVDQLPRDLGRVCVIAQTTQSGERFTPIVERIKSVYPEAKVFSTVCGATAQHQKEIKEIAPKVQLMIVVGGRQSANTRRLAEISRQCGVETIHIETAEELSFDKISQYKNIGVTAGASTPHWVLRNVIERLREFEDRVRPLPFRLITHLVRFLIYSQLYLAVGAGGLSFAVQVLLSLPLHSALISLAATYVLSMHTLNRLLSLPREIELLYGLQKYFASHKTMMWCIGILAGVFSLLLSVYLGLAAIVLVSLSLVFGAIYSLPILPQHWLPFLRYRRLMDIPGSKDLFTAIGWAVVTVVVPFGAHGARVPIPGFLLSLFIVLLLVLVRSMIIDVRGIESDIILGRETIPIVLGLAWVNKIVFSLLGLLALVLFGGWAFHVFSPLSLLMLFTVGYIILTCSYKWSAEFYHSLAYDALIDGQFILIGCLALIWKLFVQ